MSATVHTIGGEWGEAQCIAELPGVDEAIQGLLEDQTGDNATLLVREVMRAIAARAGDALAQIAALLAINGKEPQGPAEIVRLVGAHVRTNRELGGLIHDMTVANQAAWIEWKHGGGAEEAMQWVENGLAGPGLIPGDDEDDDIESADPILRDAQGYFDRHSSWGRGAAPGLERAERLLATKNDRELLDFIDAQRVALDHVSAHGEASDCIVLKHDCGKLIGNGATAREALRAAIRATAPQADLFAEAAQ